MLRVYKVVFLCGFSNRKIREKLSLSNLKWRNWACKIIHHPPFKYSDFAIWVSDYIEEFEKHEEYEFHVLSPHRGMIRKQQDFTLNGIHYHFFKKNSSLFGDLMNARFKLEQISDYYVKRRVIKRLIDRINPDIIVLCGAENPDYSSAVLDVRNKPVYVILQTLLNSKKRIEMGVGSDYRRAIENRIFSHVVYYSTSNKEGIDYISHINNRAQFLSAGFPSHRPVVDINKGKTYDFVFFARGITKNKGIEDAIKALAIVKKEKADVSLAIIGGCEVNYEKTLRGLISALGIESNVDFKGFYPSIDDSYNEVSKSRSALLPGITAGLNSTVREAMLMGMPTICYATSYTDVINVDKCCLITARMNDVEDLAEKMLFTILQHEEAGIIAASGQEYAHLHFSNSAIVDKLLENCKLIVEEYNEHGA